MAQVIRDVRCRFGPVMIKYTPATFEVLDAPEEVEISLDVIQKSQAPGLYISGDTILLGTENTVFYQITGWDAEKKVLTARKVG